MAGAALIGEELMPAPFDSAGKRRMLALTLLLFGLSALVITALVFLAAAGLNRVAAENQVHVARSVLATERENLGKTATDYSWWNTAIEKLLVGFDRDWAVINLATYLHATFGVTRVWVVDGEDQLMFAAADGLALAAERLPQTQPPLERLIERARAAPIQPVAALTDLVAIDQVPHLIAIGRFIPEQGSEPPKGAPTDGRGVLILARAIDRAFLDRVGERFLLEDLHLAPDAFVEPTEGRLTLTAEGEIQVGTLHWLAAHPGTDLLLRLLVPLLLAILLLGWLSWRITELWLRENRRADLVDQQLLAVLEGAAETIVAFDELGRVTGLNRTGEHLFGEPAGTLVGRPIDALLCLPGCAAEPPGETVLLTLAADAGSPVARDLEVRGTRGRTITVEARVSRGWRDHRTVFTAILRDITSRREIEIALKEAKDAAEQASRSKSAFMAGISHELRTPLHGILGFSDLIRTAVHGPLGNEQYRSYAEEIHGSGERLLAIVNDVIDIAGIQAGQREVAPAQLGLPELVDSVLRLLRPQAELSGVRLISGVGREAPRLLADERMVRQMLKRLVSNAISFSPQGGEVSVSVTRDLEERLGLVVCDQEERRPLETPAAGSPRLAGRDAGLEQQRSGSGLDLPLAQALIELHQGRLELNHHPEQGTRITLWFPASRVAGQPRP
jgi:PAS domain S-box-containing protein